MKVVYQGNGGHATPCVPVMNASDGKAGVMDIHHVSTAESALLDATMMKILAFSRTVPVVSLV